MTHASPSLAQRPHPSTTPGTAAGNAPPGAAFVSVCAITGLAIAVGMLVAWSAFGADGAAWASRTMKVNTALCIGLCASSLLVRARGRGRWAIAADLAAGGAMAIAGLTLLEYATGVHLPIHEWLAADPRPETLNRMAPNTAACLFLVGAAQLALGHRALPRCTSRRLVSAGQWLALTALAVSTMALVGYVYDATFFYRPTRFISMAPATVAGLIPLTLATLALRPESGIARLFLSDSPGGAVCRVLLVPGIVGPALVGWLRLEAVAFGIMSRGMATAAASLLISGLFVVLIVSLARRLDGIDNLRRATVEDLLHTGELTAALAGAASVSEVVEITVRLGTPTLGAGAGGFFRVSEDGEALELAQRIGDGGFAGLEGHRVPLSARLPVTEAFRSREAILLRSREELLSRFPDVPAVVHDGFFSWGALPLVGRERVHGVLCLCFDGERSFDAVEQGRLVALASHCTQALERALLFDSEKRARAAAEAAVREREEAHVLLDAVVREGRRAREEAEAANRAKDEFLAVLGHELRNPLSPIVTSLALMERRGPELLVRERSVIQRQVDHMLRLVDDLLDIARIARGKVELKRRPMQLAEAVARAIELASPALEQRSHRLVVTVPQEGLPILADEHRIVQAITNLLTNAARYSEPGRTVGVLARRIDDRVLLEVMDEGIGIPTELLPRIFDQFVQGQRRLERAQGGLGLGLALVKSFVELHGGTVQARSGGTDQGSTFSIELPLHAGDAAEGQLQSRVCSTGDALRVLVVDDNVDAAQLLAELLVLAGHEVRVAHDGPTALDLAHGFDFDLGLLDLGLPVMDGWELARRIRERGAGEQPVLVAITGYGQEADRARSREVGFNHHLVKPVDGNAILSLARSVRSVERGALP